MSGRAPSSQYYHHNNNPSSSSNNRTQPRPSPGATAGGAAAAASPSASITCELCGCLNFSTEWTTCEPCRQKEAAATTASSSSSAGTAAAASSGSGKASPANVAALPVSPKTAILKKQTPVPPPSTGIVTGLRHGLPIDAYRNGGRRNSSLGAKITRDSESPASSQSQSQSQSQSATLIRSNSSSDVNRRASGESHRSQQAEKPSSQAKELYQRVLVQQRQSLDAKRKAGLDTNYKTTGEADETDEKDGIAQDVDASSSTANSSSSNVTSGAASSVAESLGASSRPNKRPRTAGNSREVIDLISSSDEADDDDDDDDDVKSADGTKQNTDVAAANNDKPSGREPRVQPPATSTTAMTKLSVVRTEPSAASAVLVGSAVAAARIPIAAAATDATSLSAAAVALQPQGRARETAMTSDEDEQEGKSSFLSRRFPVVAFDPIDFPPTDAAAAMKLRARRGSSGVEGNAAIPVVLSQQPAAVLATAAPVRSAVVGPPVVAPSLKTPEVAQEKEKEKATPPAPAPKPVAPMVQKPTPAPAPTAPVAQKAREEPAKTQASVPTVPSNAGVATAEAPPQQQQTDSRVSSALPSTPASSIRSLKRAAFGNCQEQAIELGDDDKSSQELVFSTRGAGLFQSRVFQSVEFNASDFSTVHDGLHVARRSKIAAQNEVPEPQQQHQQQQRVVGGAASAQERATNATTARNDRATPPSNSQYPAPATAAVPSSPATIPSDSVSATTAATSSSAVSASASAPESRHVPRGAQPIVPAHQVNVVPMSPREPSVQSVESKPPAARAEVKAPAPSVQRATPSSSIAARPVPPPQQPTLVSKPTATPPVATMGFPPLRQVPAPVSKPAAISANSVKPIGTPVPVPASKPTGPAPLLHKSSALPANINRSSEAARTTTTASAECERSTATSSATTSSSSTITTTATTTILLARKKIPQATPVSVSSGAPVSTTEVEKANTPAVLTLSSHPVAKKEEVVIQAREAVTIAKRISKPLALGECSADFMSFMKDLVDGDDDEPLNDEEETRKLHLQLLEVVDLTNLTDSDDDDSSDGGDDISEPLTPTGAGAAGVNPAKPVLVLTGGDRPAFGSQSMHQYPTPAFGVVSGLGQTGFFASGPSRTGPQVTFTAAAGGIVTAAGSIAGPPKPDRRRAVRQLEPCVICEEKRWVKTLIHCKDCGKYYHKKCAKDYGDEKICWNCELDGMIDDSDLTETARDEIVDMLSTLRHASSSSSEGEGDDEDDEAAENADGGTHSNGEGDESKKDTDNDEDDDDEEESRRDSAAASTAAHRPPMLPGSSTKSMQRWKTFLNVSTSTVDKTFHEVTKSIDAELQSEEQKAKYSKGFTTPEIFQAQISEVLDSYADLQDQLDREAREKPRGPPSGGGNADSGAPEVSAVPAATTVESVVASSSVVRESSTVSTRVILDLSGSSDGPVQSVQTTQQLNREVVISDGA